MEREKEEADSCRNVGRMPVFGHQVSGLKSAEIVAMSSAQLPKIPASISRTYLQFAENQAVQRSRPWQEIT